MEVAEREDPSYANSFQVLDLPQKKKKKKKRKSETLNGEAVPLCHSPLPSDHSIVPESELNSEVGGNLVPKKKKKRKRQSGVGEIDIPEIPKMAPGLSEAADGEGVEQDDESPPLKKKKKKKRKSEALNGEAIPVCHSPLPSDHSLSVPWQVESQDTEGSPAPEKKSKKKAEKEILESRDGSSSIVPESELNSEVGGNLVPRKRKRRPIVGEIHIPETPEIDPGLSAAADGEGVEQDDESPPLRKKKKKKKSKGLSAEAEGGREVSSLPTHEETDLADPNRADPSDAEASVDLFASSPTRPDMYCRPLLEGEDEVAGSDPSHASDSPPPQKKARRRRKTTRSASPRVKGSHGGHVVEEVGESAPDRRPKTTSPACPEAEAPASPTSEASSYLDEDFLEAVSIPAIDLESATKELEEFIPHVRSLTESAIRQLASRDLDRFKRFKEKGVAVRFGRFSKPEDKLLRKNVKAFLEESRIDSAEKLLFTHRFPEEKAEINRLKAKLLFGLRIAEGIPRPWRHVYYRGRRLFDPQNYKGKFSEKEKQQLKKFQAMYGNSWTKISELMCRSSKSVEQKYSNIRSDPKYGPWTGEETEKLTQAIAEVLRAKAKSTRSPRDREKGDRHLLLDRDMIYKSIPWTQIEAEVETRSWKQCRKKWYSVIAKRLTGRKMIPTKSENTRFRIKLIRRLSQLDVEEESAINWEDISSVMGNLPPSYLQSRYYKMKTAYVPFWNQRSFSEIIYFLYEKKLPQLKAQVKLNADEQKAAAATEDKNTFLFSHLFPEPSQDVLADNEEEEEE